jgi:hypothetical protein
MAFECHLLVRIFNKKALAMLDNGQGEAFHFRDLMGLMLVYTDKLDKSHNTTLTDRTLLLMLARRFLNDL